MGKGFLCIKRYPGQRVLMDKGVEIAVGEVRGESVQLCIRAEGVAVRWPDKEQDKRDRVAYRERREHVSR